MIIIILLQTQGAVFWAMHGQRDCKNFFSHILKKEKKKNEQLT